MKDLVIKRNIDFPGFGTWKWNEDDYNKPLTISVGQSKFHFFINKDKLFGRDLQVLPSGYIEILFSPPPKALVKALNSKGQAAVEAVEKIYQCYVEAYEKFQSLLMSAGKVTRLLYDRPMSIHTFRKVKGSSLLLTHVYGNDN